jgi:hypothetical protein
MYVKKDDVKVFVGLHGSLYRWEWRFSQVAGADLHQDSVTQAKFHGDKSLKDVVGEMSQSTSGNVYATIQKG